jgi:hypothetical protein
MGLYLHSQAPENTFKGNRADAVAQSKSFRKEGGVTCITDLLELECLVCVFGISRSTNASDQSISKFGCER